MTINTQKLRERIDAAIKRITSGSAPMRVPAENTDPDLVLADAKTALEAQAAEIAHRKSTFDLIVNSVCAALERAGVEAVDDPGEAIDVLVAGKDREIARLKAAPVWQPIETAPKDGSTVLLRGRGDHRIADGSWLQAAHGGLGAWVWPYVHSEPHHWMPLPAGPDALQETRQ